MQDYYCQKCGLVNSINVDKICNICDYDNGKYNENIKLNITNLKIIEAVEKIKPDVVVIFADCFHNLSEDGKLLANKYPSINESEKLSRRGDTNKLGRWSKTYIWNNIDIDMVILICYVKYNNDIKEMDYMYLRDILSNINNNFHDKHVLFQSTEGKDKEQLDIMLSEEMTNMKITLVE